jgi:hypothetical protein
MSFIRPVILHDGKLTVAPVAAVTCRVQALQNGLQKNLATVSVGQVPATFAFAPEAGETYYLYSLSLGFASSGTPDPSDFGNIPALAQGIDLDLCTSGQSSTLVNIKDNLDLALSFNLYSSTGGAAGFLNSADLYLGSILFPAPIILKGSSSDYVRAVVKNATTSSGSDLRIYAHLYKEVA